MNEMDDNDELTGQVAGDDDLQALLRDLTALVPDEPPEPRGALADLLAGKRVLPRQRRNRRTVAGGTALAIGVVLGSGVAAAASNHLPDPAQRAAHDFARSFLPFAIPAPASSRHHRVATEPDAPHHSTLPTPSAEPATATGRHGSGERAGEEASGTSGRRSSSSSGDRSEDSRESGSDDRQGSEPRDGDDGASTSGRSGGSDDGARGTASGDSSGHDSSGGSSGDSGDSGDSGGSGSSSGSGSSDGSGSGGSDGGGSDSADDD